MVRAEAQAEDPERLIEVMVGGDVEGEFVKDNTPGSAPLLEVHGLTRAAVDDLEGGAMDRRVTAVEGRPL